MKEIVLIGGGGHCKSCIDVLESTGRFSINGILDIEEKVGEKLLSYQIIGTDNLIEKYIQSKISFCIAIGKIGAGTGLRANLFNKLISMDADLPVIISPFAVISKYSSIGKGAVVFAEAIINSDAQVMENCIINTKALIEHDVVVGKNCHISTGAIINGNCVIGDNCMIGSGAVIGNGINIVSDTMIGMGSVVTRSICSSGLYFGIPARKIK